METTAKTIVFCGVHFMAETACILNPEKTVLLPKEHAGCDLADMATLDQVQKKKREHPDAAVVSYVNSSAAIKSVSDICCTSANAVEVVNSLPQQKIIFIPDKNLGSYIAERTNKTIILWQGYCYVHEQIQPSKIKELQQKHPDAIVIVHPECPSRIRDLAEYIGSTSKMTTYTQESEADEFIVGTDDNFIHHLKKHNPEKSFFSLDTGCHGMREIQLHDVKIALEEQEHVITVPEPIRKKAFNALDKMMKVV